jgi:hypothetical protein
MIVLEDVTYRDVPVGPYYYDYKNFDKYYYIGLDPYSAPQTGVLRENEMITIIFRYYMGT